MNVTIFIDSTGRNCLELKLNKINLVSCIPDYLSGIRDFSI